MTRDKILVVFALAWLYCSTGHGQTDPSIPCDDKRVEDVVNLTLTKHNEILTEGVQLALYEILAATKVGVLLFAFNNILIYATLVQRCNVHRLRMNRGTLCSCASQAERAIVPREVTSFGISATTCSE